MGSITLLAYVPINIDPVIFYIGPSALRWHGLMYVVGIVFGLWVIRGYTALIGITQDMVYRILWWCVVAGLTRSAHGSTQSGKPAGTRILVTDSRNAPTIPPSS